MAKYQNVNPLTKVHEDEPWFFIRAQDKLSVEAVMAYSQLLNKASNRSIANGDIVTGEFLQQQVNEIIALAHKMLDWQEAHPDLVKYPD